MRQPSKLSISVFSKGDTHRKRTRHSDLNFKTGSILKLQTVLNANIEIQGGA